MHPVLQRILVRGADAWIERRSPPAPSPSRLSRCRLIAHRGQHDNRTCLENTVPAFDLAAGAGVWGIELDIRWTRDLEPVVFHDPDLRRMFGGDRRIADFSLTRLHECYPDIPSLARVVERFGGRVHLMIEIKQAPWRDRVRQVGRLQEILRPLAPGIDFHLITLHPEMLLPFADLPPAVLAVVADPWPARYSRWVLDHGWGGICGHFLLVTQSMIRSHQERGQAVGTGFARSRQCLFRELNRGIDWIFSNDAVGLQAVVDRWREDV